MELRTATTLKGTSTGENGLGGNIRNASNIASSLTSALIKLTIPKLYQQRIKDTEEKAKLRITPRLPLRRKLKS
jgi:hypothetical protein